VETIDSRTAGPDRIFSAIVEHEVRDTSGRVMIPEGSSAQLMIRQLSSGAGTRSSEMALDIQAITIGGRRYVVSTTDVTLDSGTGIGKNKRTGNQTGADKSWVARADRAFHEHYRRAPQVRMATRPPGRIRVCNREQTPNAHPTYDRRS